MPSVRAISRGFSTFTENAQPMRKSYNQLLSVVLSKIVNFGDSDSCRGVLPYTPKLLRSLIV
ncbi:MAG: hypothetical protein Fur006_33560 [Coleofasciculaceae cyanobacterium]